MKTVSGRRFCRRGEYADERAAGVAEPEFAVTDGFVTTIRRAPAAGP